LPCPFGYGCASLNALALSVIGKGNLLPLLRRNANLSITGHRHAELIPHLLATGPLNLRIVLNEEAT
jgi:hypothetical protein